MDQQTRACKFEIRKVGDDGVFSGYGSVFDVEDSYGTVFVPGAFKASLAKHKRESTMPALLWQHNRSEPLGVWTVMREDERGLWCEGKLLAEVARAKEALALLRAGAINGLSVGFRTIVDEWDRDTDQVKIKEVDLWETSIVTFPANMDARIEEVKSHGDQRDLRGLFDAVTRRDEILRSV